MTVLKKLDKVLVIKKVQDMKESTKVQLLAVIILIVLAVVDAFLVFVPIVAILGIAIVLFKPKWFLRSVKNIFGE